MTTGQTNRVITYLHRVALLQERGGATDAQLMELPSSPGVRKSLSKNCCGVTAPWSLASAAVSSATRTTPPTHFRPPSSC